MVLQTLGASTNTTSLDECRNLRQEYGTWEGSHLSRVRVAAFRLMMCFFCVCASLFYLHKKADFLTAVSEPAVLAAPIYVNLSELPRGGD